MKKFKKIITLALMLVMTMAMGLTAMAEESTDYVVTVSNAQADTVVKWIQVVEEDSTTSTGWAFTEAGKKAFETAFNSTDDQAILKSLADNKFDASTFATALGNVVTNAGDKMATVSNSKFTVPGAGLYAVTAADAEYTYTNMSCSVSFGELGTNLDLSLKRSEISLDKVVDDADHATQIGDTLTYTITVNVPYINTNATDKTFFVYDALTGGEYDLTNATVKMGEASVGTITLNEDKKGFSIDLSSLIDSTNSNVNKSVVVTYQVKATEVKTENTATAGHKGGSEFGSKTVTVYTGSVELTKYAETQKDGNELAGAKFVLKNESGKYATVADGKLVAWVDAEKDATTLTTDENGKIKVSGLAIGTYYFHETEAPAGYAVTTTDATAKVALNDGVTVVASFDDFNSTAASTAMIDGKLGSLPFTGGMGTTLFTVLGVVLMALAAGLFFATSKKKSATK